MRLNIFVGDGGTTGGDESEGSRILENRFKYIWPDIIDAIDAAWVPSLLQ